MSNYNSPAAARKPAHVGYPGQTPAPKAGGPLTRKFGGERVSALLSALMSVRADVEDETVRTKYGLCWQLDEALEDAGENPENLRELSNCLYRAWPDFSGDINYPVPGRGTDDEDEAVAGHWASYYYNDGEALDFDYPPEVAEAYYNAVEDGVLHDENFWAGAYGEKRKQLLQFMIDTLVAEGAA